jgi:hypothetical protein
MWVIRNRVKTRWFTTTKTNGVISSNHMPFTSSKSNQLMITTTSVSSPTTPPSFFSPQTDIKLEIGKFHCIAFFFKFGDFSNYWFNFNYFMWRSNVFEIKKIYLVKLKFHKNTLFCIFFGYPPNNLVPYTPLIKLTNTNRLLGLKKQEEGKKTFILSLFGHHSKKKT